MEMRGLARREEMVARVESEVGWCQGMTSAARRFSVACAQKKFNVQPENRPLHLQWAMKRP